jgi:hypothetical protein
MAEIVQHLASGLQPPPESEPAAPATRRSERQDC